MTRKSEARLAREGHSVRIGILSDGSKAALDAALADLKADGLEPALTGGRPTAQAQPPGMMRRESSLMASGWQGVLENFIPPETNPQLVKTFKRFFYAGAKHLLDDLLYAADLDDGMAPTADDLSKIDAVQHELNEFFAKVGDGVE
jgi:hypothetical protein